jgi:DNA-binding NtrC family response regulator
VVLGNVEAIIEELAAPPKDSVPEAIERMASATQARLSLKEANKDAIKRTEYEIIQKTLERTNWNRKKAAELLNISYKTLLYKIKAIGLDKRFTIQTS